MMCSFYVPGDAHLLKDGVELYDELRTSYLHISKKDKIFHISDSNARLGRYSLDQNIHGK